MPNHSFEEYDTCRVFNDVYYPDDGPLGWFSASGTPDHFVSCLPYGSFNGSPLSYWVFQYPQDGECYAGVITYREFPEVREYFMVKLLEPLVVGVRYYASFYTSPGFGGPQPQVWVATSGIGMIFTTQPRQWELGDPYPPPLNYAHVYSPSIITDTVGWTLVSGSFVADSAYRYVMLGNAFDNASTDTLHFANYNWLPQGYMVIDNVCVSMDPDGCPLAVGVPDRWAEVVRLYPNPAQHRITVGGLKPGTLVRIRDLVGRNVWKGVSAGDRLSLDVEHWARGTYVLHVEGTRKRQSFKFVLTE
ncbi:MAG: T9SS type A sorting domain-containing protein [Flavobacteriales bacterium]|nr:T9SS type A sorting domain-containing protein [Flavobacteriales bacterium]